MIIKGQETIDLCMVTCIDCPVAWHDRSIASAREFARIHCEATHHGVDITMSTVETYRWKDVGEKQ